VGWAGWVSQLVSTLASSGPVGSAGLDVGVERAGRFLVALGGLPKTGQKPGPESLAFFVFPGCSLREILFRYSGLRSQVLSNLRKDVPQGSGARTVRSSGDTRNRGRMPWQVQDGLLEINREILWQISSGGQTAI